MSITYFPTGKETPANIHLLKVNDRNIRKRCEICSKLTIKTPEQHHWRRSGIFTDNFEHILHLFLVSLLFILKKKMTAWTRTADKYLFEFNNSNTRKNCEIWSRLTIKTPEDIFDVVLVSLMLTLNIFSNFFYSFYYWLLTINVCCAVSTKFSKGELSYKIMFKASNQKTRTIPKLVKISRCQKHVNQADLTFINLFLEETSYIVLDSYC